MSEIERQVRGFWARMMEWLRGARGAEAARGPGTRSMTCAPATRAARPSPR